MVLKIFSKYSLTRVLRLPQLGGGRHLLHRRIKCQQIISRDMVRLGLQPLNERAQNSGAGYPHPTSTFTSLPHSNICDLASGFAREKIHIRQDSGDQTRSLLGTEADEVRRLHHSRGIASHLPLPSTSPTSRCGRLGTHHSQRHRWSGEHASKVPTWITIRDKFCWAARGFVGDCATCAWTAWRCS